MCQKARTFSKNDGNIKMTQKPARMDALLAKSRTLGNKKVIVQTHELVKQLRAQK